jgi:adenylate kinase
MRYRTILLLGAPGAGKGTQGRILGTIPNFFYCSCGDAFRNLTADSELGRIFLEHSSRGELVPDEPTIRMWQQQIDASTALGRFRPERDTLVLDGIPRNPCQAGMLANTLDVKAVFYLSCPDTNRLVERLQRRALHENRLDDANLEVIKQRQEVYKRETKPVLDFYGHENVHTIDSIQSPVEVLRDLLAIIARLPK